MKQKLGLTLKWVMRLNYQALTGIISLKRKNQWRPLSHSRPNLCFVAVGFQNRLRHLQAWRTLMCLTIDQSWFQHSPASPWHQMPRTIYCIYQDNSTYESWGAEHCCCTGKCIITKPLTGLNKKLDAWVLELISCQNVNFMQNLKI